jgi:hypothetical protein
MTRRAAQDEAHAPKLEAAAGGLNLMGTSAKSLAAGLASSPHPCPLIFSPSHDYQMDELDVLNLPQSQQKKEKF